MAVIISHASTRLSASQYIATAVAVLCARIPKTLSVRPKGLAGAGGYATK